MNFSKEYIRDNSGEIDCNIMLYSVSIGALVGYVSTFFFYEKPNMIDCIPGMVVGEVAGTYFALGVSKAMQWYAKS